MDVRYKPSAYNHVVRLGDSWLVFNGVSSALISLDHDGYSRLSPYLFAPGIPSTGQIQTDLPIGSRFRPTLNIAPSIAFSLPFDPTERAAIVELLSGHFIVPADNDELLELKQRFDSNKSDDPLLVTVVTTMDCNLGCYYCYEDKYPSGMSNEVCDQILDYIKKDIVNRRQDRMHLGWFGGEPMLNRAAIE